MQVGIGLAVSFGGLVVAGVGSWVMQKRFAIDEDFDGVDDLIDAGDDVKKAESFDLREYSLFALVMVTGLVMFNGVLGPPARSSLVVWPLMCFVVVGWLDASIYAIGRGIVAARWACIGMVLFFMGWLVSSELHLDKSSEAGMYPQDLITQYYRDSHSASDAAAYFRVLDFDEPGDVNVKPGRVLLTNFYDYLAVRHYYVVAGGSPQVVMNSEFLKMQSGEGIDVLAATRKTILDAYEILILASTESEAMEILEAMGLNGNVMVEKRMGRRVLFRAGVERY